MTELHTRAVTIGITDYQDSDKIVTFYSERHGKITGIAKGAKRSKKRFVNKLEFFSLLNIILIPSRKSTLYRLDRAELINPYQALCESYRKYTAAMVTTELTKGLTRDNDCDENIFRLLTWSLDKISGEDKINILEIVVLFHLKLLDITGFLPQLSRCVSCGNEPNGEAAFIPSADGILCAGCLPLTGLPPSSRLSLNTVRVLKMARSLPLEKLSRLKLSSNSCRESFRMFKICISHLLQREIHSWQQFEKIMKI